MSERREQARYAVWFPMKLEAPALEDGVAVSRNVSNTGLLMVTAKRLEIGAPITVTFQMTLSVPERTVDARIVRCEPNPETSGLFPYRIAVEFTEPHADLEALLRDVEAAQRASSTK